MQGIFPEADSISKQRLYNMYSNSRPRKSKMECTHSANHQIVASSANTLSDHTLIILIL